MGSSSQSLPLSENLINGPEFLSLLWVFASLAVLYNKSQYCCPLANTFDDWKTHSTGYSLLSIFKNFKLNALNAMPKGFSERRDTSNILRLGYLYRICSCNDFTDFCFWDNAKPV